MATENTTRALHTHTWPEPLSTFSHGCPAVQPQPMPLPTLSHGYPEVYPQPAPLPTLSHGCPVV